MNSFLNELVSKIRSLPEAEQNASLPEAEQNASLSGAEQNASLSGAEQNAVIGCGLYENRKRFRRKDCGRNFNNFTGGALHGIHKKDKRLE